MIRLLSIFILFITTTFSSATFSIEGDTTAGEEKSAVCATCHNVDGNSSVDQFPKLAGQVPGYISSQLAAYKAGTRKNPIMAAQAAILTPQDMADLDAFYSSQKPKIGSVTEVQVEIALKGEAIYRSGYKKYNIPACMGCHGPNGAGIPSQYPRLAGQHMTYISEQLKSFKNGSRENAVMQSIAFLLSEEQINQLALYISALK